MTIARARLNYRQLHKVLGLLLLVPLLGWALTGAVFILQPGYAAAYAELSPKRYPLTAAAAITPQPNWLEFKVLHTILGEHLLVHTPLGWQQLDPSTMLTLGPPQAAELAALVADAITVDEARYGQVLAVHGSQVVTSTGVKIDVDWSSLSLRQQGQDTRLIDTLYKIHYLQWWGHQPANTVFAVVALLCVVALVIYGVLVYWHGRN